MDREEFTSFYAASFPRLVGQLYALEIAITPNGKTAYITGPGAVVVPVSTATNRPGKPIRIGSSGPGIQIVITPDGKTVYVVASNEVVPVNTATNQPGQPIRVPYGMPGGAVITP